MPLFEHMPYTNFENVNLDWIVNTIKTHQTDIDQLKADVGDMQTTIVNIQGDITTIQENITNIIEQIGEIDIEALEARVDDLEEEDVVINNKITNVLTRVMGDEENIETNTTNITNNDLASVNRDNALSARISALERAHLHDVYNYYAEGNQCLFGSDLRNLPSACKTSDGYPAGWGNKSNRTEGQTVARSFKFVDNGMCADTTSTGYDYYQVGRYSSGLLNEGVFTVTFAVSTGGDATPTWYSHTFQSESDIWTVAENCTIKFRNFLSWSGADTFYKTIGFQGTAANWNTFLNGKYIVFIYVEAGTGSVAHDATDKCRFDIKDRLFFTEMPTPALPATYVEQRALRNKEVDAYYIDAVGEQVSYKLPIALASFTLWADVSGKIVAGYCAITVKKTSAATSVSQLDGIQENGCYVDGYIDLPDPVADPTSPMYPSAHGSVINWRGTSYTYDASTYNAEDNINLQGSLVIDSTYGSTAPNKIHIKIQSPGFAIDGNTRAIGSFPISLYRVNIMDL